LSKKSKKTGSSSGTTKLGETGEERETIIKSMELGIKKKDLRRGQKAPLVRYIMALVDRKYATTSSR
jgi:hypothetical protein